MKSSTERICLDHITIVLQQPRFPENIGAAARAMRNMGIRRMIVVDPENYDLSRVLKMATHVAADVVQEIRIVQTSARHCARFTWLWEPPRVWAGSGKWFNPLPALPPD